MTALGGCSASGTQLNCGPVTALTSPMVINVGDSDDSVTIDASVNSTIPSITIIGGTGNDTLTNNSNRSVTFIGGPGNDTITGLGNHDTVDYSSSANGVHVDLSAGTATGDGSDTLANIGNVVGSSHDDTIAGDDRANDLQGGLGTDTMDYPASRASTANGITLYTSARRGSLRAPPRRAPTRRRLRERDRLATSATASPATANANTIDGRRRRRHGARRRRPAPTRSRTPPRRGR